MSPPSVVMGVQLRVELPNQGGGGHHNHPLYVTT